jgi:hypothetical protein
LKAGFVGHNILTQMWLRGDRGNVKKTGTMSVLWLMLCALLGLMLVSVAPAEAARGHVFGGAFGKPGAGPGEFKEPSDVAVNEATGAVYVLDQGNARVQRFAFNAAAKIYEFLGEVKGPSAAGTGTLTAGSATIEALATSAGAFTVGETISGAGIPAETTIVALKAPGVIEISKPVETGKSGSGVPLTARQAFAFGKETLTGGIAVDNSCYFKGLSEGACANADPSNGDLYVTDKQHEVVDKFSPAGEYIGQLQEASGIVAFKFTEINGAGVTGVGVDTNGIVWVAGPIGGGGALPGVVASFTSATNNTFVSAGKLQNSAVIEPGFAVDSEDDLYARREPTGSVPPHTISKFGLLEPSGGIYPSLLEPFDPEAASAVAVDLSSNEVFIDHMGSVSALTKSGFLEERFGSGLLTAGAGLAESHAKETAYVADSALAMVDVFLPEPPAKPSVQAQSVSDLASESATFTAELNPRGEPTEYRFEYGPCPSLEGCAASGYEKSAPVPDGFVGSDFEVHAVSVHVRELHVDSAYHFRVVAHNEFGVVVGEERVFMTQGMGGALLLPDGRSWELVSPPDKRGASIFLIGELGVQRSSSSGTAVTYSTTLPTEEHPQGHELYDQILSTRGAGGWTSQDISIAQRGAVGYHAGFGADYRFVSEDLSQALVEPQGEEFTSLKPEVFPPDSERTPYVRHDSTCAAMPSTCFQPLVTGCPSAPLPCEPLLKENADVPEGTKFGGTNVTQGAVNFVGATPDLAHVILTSNTDLTSIHTNGTGGLYEWSAGSAPAEQLQLAGLFPCSPSPCQGQPAEGAKLGEGHAVSAFGSRIVWLVEGGHLYLRDTVKHQTLQLDLPEAACPPAECPNENVAPTFESLSSDGSKVFFTDSQRLTRGSGALNGKADLYECEVVEVGGELQCELHDLTPPSAGEAADVRGVLGASEDGAWVYFVANGVLAEGAKYGALAGSCQQDQAHKEICNLYVWHGGETLPIAVLSGEDFLDWEPVMDRHTARVAPAGGWLAFMSSRSLTGYDNVDANSPPGRPNYDEEVFLYRAKASQVGTLAPGALVCASCNPTGERPVGIEFKSLEIPKGEGLVTGHAIWPPTTWTAANVPGWTPYAITHPLYQSRYLSNEGRLFFNSHDALVPQDINHNEDVYEYEPAGFGSCSSSSPTFSARSSGCVSLISSGRASGESGFLDASENGEDVFFLTGERLVPQEVERGLSVYDAHVCSAVAPCVSSSTSPPPCTTADSCRAAPSPQPSIFGAPASETFSGTGNLTLPPPTRPITLTRAQKLTKALKMCRTKYRRDGRRRRACEHQAHKRYGAKQARKAKGRGRQ